MAGAISPKVRAEGWPLILADVETMGTRISLHSSAEKVSRVRRMPSDPSEAMSAGATPLA